MQNVIFTVKRVIPVIVIFALRRVVPQRFANMRTVLKLAVLGISTLFVPAVPMGFIFVKVNAINVTMSTVNAPLLLIVTDVFQENMVATFVKVIVLLTVLHVQVQWNVASVGQANTAHTVNIIALLYAGTEVVTRKLDIVLKDV